MVQVTWPRWPPCPYMVKTFKNLLLKNQKTYDLETWHVALGTQALQSYINDDPGLTLTYFTARSNLVPYAFVWEKGKTMDFLETIVWFETSNRWPKWQEVSVDIKTLSPGGCMPPALGLYICIKSWKKCIKSDFKEISLKLATNG